mgnify:CR=1 FL=1
MDTVVHVELAGRRDQARVLDDGLELERLVVDDDERGPLLLAIPHREPHLVAGGVGYVTSAFVDYAVDAPAWLVDALAIPATVGELWMIGYLLVVGIRPAPNR